jgi:hypothetical protein
MVLHKPKLQNHCEMKLISFKQFFIYHILKNKIYLNDKIRKNGKK